MQKADLVRYIKNTANKITLAVGDGNNDCNMIKEADIGIGIFGNLIIIIYYFFFLILFIIFKG